MPLQTDLEIRLLAAAPDAEAFLKLEESGFSTEAFGRYRPVYDYLEEAIEEHGFLPPLEDLYAVFNLPDGLTRGTAEFSWLLSEFKKVTTVRAIQETVDESVQRYGADPGTMLGDLINGLSAISIPGVSSISITDRDMPKRMDRYETLAKQRGRLSGVPTGLRHFDTTVGLGWQPGELVGVIGRTYTGKTFLLFYFGLAAWAFGKRVLMVSPELGLEEAEARFDALYLGSQGLKVDIMDLYKGVVPNAQMQQFASRAAQTANWVTVTTGEGQSLRIGDLKRLVRQYRPDLLIIDGLSLIPTGSKTQQVWESIKDLSYGLKTMAVESSVPIIVAHQASRAASNTSKPPGLHEISFGDAFAQACDRILALAAPKSEPNTLLVAIPKFRRGTALVDGTKLQFEPGRGVIYERDPEAPIPGTSFPPPEEADAPYFIP